MSLRKKRLPKEPTEPVSQAPKESVDQAEILAVQKDILSELRAIRLAMPSRQHRLLMSVLSGVIAKRGPCGGDGKPASDLMKTALDFVDAAVTQAVKEKSRD